jgi:hypothetical protein
VITVKEQMCDFETNFVFRFDDTAELRFLHPILLDSDIVWLAGAEPSEIEVSGDQLVMRYVIEKVMQNPDPANEYMLELFFEKSDGENRLSTVRLDGRLSRILMIRDIDKTLMESRMQGMCEAGWASVSRKMELDLSEEDLSRLPSRNELLRLMGPPLAFIDNATGLAYEYRLKGQQAEAPTATFSIWYDESGNLPLRMESHYSRYHTRADFISRRMSVKVEL